MLSLPAPTCSAASCRCAITSPIATAVEVGLRVGINTGEVVIDDADADLVGDVLNTAARLEAACTPGQVLVGEETWRLTRSTLGYEPLGEVTVKGKRDGLATYQLVMADDGSGARDRSHGASRLDTVHRARRRTRSAAGSPRRHAGGRRSPAGDDHRIARRRQDPAVSRARQRGEQRGRRRGDPMRAGRYGDVRPHRRPPPAGGRPRRRRHPRADRRRAARSRRWCARCRPGGRVARRVRRHGQPTLDRGRVLRRAPSGRGARQPSSARVGDRRHPVGRAVVPRPARAPRRVVEGGAGADRRARPARVARDPARAHRDGPPGGARRVARRARRRGDRAARRRAARRRRPAPRS